MKSRTDTDKSLSATSTFAMRRNCGIDQAMLYLAETLFDSTPFNIEVFLRDKNEPRPSSGVEMQVSYCKDVIGVKELIVGRLFPDKNLSPSDVILIFSAGLGLKHVSTPAEKMFKSHTWSYLLVSVADDLKVKTFLKHGNPTIVDVLLVNGPDGRRSFILSWCFMVENLFGKY